MRPLGQCWGCPWSGRHTQVRPASQFLGFPAVAGPGGTWDLKENEQKARRVLCNHQTCLQPGSSFHHLSFNQSIHPAVHESHLHLTFHHLDPRVCQFLPGGYYYQSSVSRLMYERHLGVNGGNCRPQSVLHCSFIDLSRSPCRESRKQGLHEDPHYMTRY